MGVSSAVKSFVVENFWMPATGTAEAYNIFNTSFYAAGFAVAAAYLGYPLLKKLDLALDRRFFIGITPFIFLGSAVRVLEDLAVADTVLLVTPFIYVLMFLLTVALLTASLKFFGENYHQPLAVIGTLMFLGVLSLYSFNNLSPLVNVLFLFGAVTGIGYALLRQFRPELLTYSFTVPVAAHYWDASTTVTALSFGATEKHVLANFFIDLFGASGMFIMKTLVIVPAVYYIDRNLEGDEKLYYLFLIALLGIALGVRNILSVVTVT